MNKLRRRICIFGLLLSAVLFCFGIFTACEKTEKITYTVSVVMPDDKPAAGVTVVWNKDGTQAASAPVNSQGKATAELTADIYEITLSGLPIGYSYTQGVKTDRLGTEISIALSTANVAYTATVTMPDGSAAAGVTVTWSLDNKVAGAAKTNASGVATCDLAVNTYTVTAEGVINGESYYTETPVTVNGDNLSAAIQLTTDERIDYKVTVRSEGGVNLPDVDVLFVKDGEPVYSNTTGKDGQLTAKLRPDEYIVSLDLNSLPGYSAKDPAEPYTTVTEKDSVVTFTLSSKIIDSAAPSSNKYVVGDIMYDFTVKTYDGKTVTLSKLFETKKAVVINFWYTSCSWCFREMPAMQEAYTQFSDKLEIIGLDPTYANGDTNASIANFVATQANYITFPLAIDTASVAYMFGVEGFPTTVVIDRYGAAAYVHSNAILDTETWVELFEKYTADDYTQTFTPGVSASDPAPTEYAKPTEGLAMPASDEIVEAVVNSNYQDKFKFHDAKTEGTSDAEYSWPWVIKDYDGKKVLAPSNSGTHFSFSSIYLTVELEANEAFLFTFYSSTEDYYDACHVINVKSNLVPWQITGEGNKWDTCYAFVADKAGTYEFAFLYLKDTGRSKGEDAVYINDLRICSASEIKETVDVVRHAAEDMNEAGTGYNNYVTAVFNDEDGYYHVNNVNGPILLADLMNQSQWSNIPLWYYVSYSESQEAFLDTDGDGIADAPLKKLDLMYDFDGDGAKEDCFDVWETYAYMASNSDYAGLVPVDARLYELINLLIPQLSENHTDKEWLEVCKYVDRYGTTGIAPDPTYGLSWISPITASEGKNHFNMTKVIEPFGYMHYAFTPAKSGIYRFYSENAGKYGSQIVAYEIGTGKGYRDLNNIIGDSDSMDDFNMVLPMAAGRTYYFACAINEMAMTGEFDFYIEYTGESYQEWTACSGNTYIPILDENGNLTGGYENNLVGAVKYELGQDGVYYAINDNGTKTKIYVDLVHPTRLYPNQSIEVILDTYVGLQEGDKLPDGTTLHPFNLQYALVWDADENLEQITYYYIKLLGEYCKDYTETVRKYVEQSKQNEGDYYGLCEATEEIVDILKFFQYIRGGEYEKDLKPTDQEGVFNLDTTPDDIEYNEWLSFCVYYKTYSAESAEPTDEQTATVGNKIGNRCPDFTVPLYGNDGNYSVTDTRGKVTIINFWADWCSPCVSEIPEFEQFYQDYSDDVSIVAICIEPDSDTPAFLTKKGWDKYGIKFAHDDANASLYYELGETEYIPVTLILDQNGVIVYNSAGTLSYDQLLACVKPLLNK